MTRKTFAIALAASLLMAFAFSCSKDGNPSGGNPNGTGTAPVFAGEWRDTVPPVPGYIKDFVCVDAVLAFPESTYTLVSWYATTGDTLLKESGKWSSNAANDTVFLAGANCAIYDTTQKQLRTLDSCGAPAAIPVNISNNVWLIKVSDMGAVAQALHIDISNSTVQKIILPFQHVI